MTHSNSEQKGLFHKPVILLSAASGILAFLGTPTGICFLSQLLLGTGLGGPSSGGVCLTVDSTKLYSR